MGCGPFTWRTEAYDVFCFCNLAGSLDLALKRESKSYQDLFSLYRLSFHPNQFIYLFSLNIVLLWPTGAISFPLAIVHFRAYKKCKQILSLSTIMWNNWFICRVTKKNLNIHLEFNYHMFLHIALSSGTCQVLKVQNNFLGFYKSWKFAAGKYSQQLCGCGEIMLQHMTVFLLEMLKSFRCI